MNEFFENYYVGKILFVDRDIDMLKVMESILKADRFQVVTMLSAEEGLKQLETDGSFDFVISGYSLPGMNGLCFLNQVAGLHQGTVRILMSGGYADFDEVGQAISCGYISRYVSKPFCFKTFLDDLKNDLAAARVNFIAN